MVSPDLEENILSQYNILKSDKAFRSNLECLFLCNLSGGCQISKKGIVIIIFESNKTKKI